LLSALSFSRPHRRWGGGKQDPTGVGLRNLTLRNVSGDATTAGYMHCRSNNPCVNISFDGVDVKTTGRFSDAPHWNCSHAFGSAIGDVKPPLNGCLQSHA